MKYCPRCNFTFADFHHVCDFDGTELMSDPERPSLEKPERWARTRRLLKSPVLLAAAGLIVVVASAFLIGYYEVVDQTTSIVKTTPSPTLPINALPRAQDAQSPETNTIAEASAKNIRRTTESSRRRQRAASATLARLRRQPRNAAKGSEVARRTESPQSTSKKDPLLTAMLKTTWRVLKKPFNF